jgi:signal transduction histidine kinase
LLLVLGGACTDDEVEHPVALLDTLEVAEDPTGRLSLQDISSPERAGLFQHRPGLLNLGLSQSTFWIRLKLDAGQVSGMKGRRVVSIGAFLLEVDAYVASDAINSGAWERVEPVEALQRSIGPMAFELPALREGSIAILFRVRSGDALLISPQLMSVTSYVHGRTAVSLRKGAYYGLMIGVIGYNLFLAVWLRDRAYFLYVLFETAFCVTMSALDRTLGVIWPLILPVLHDGLTLKLMTATTTASVVFSREFLDLRGERRFARASMATVCVGVSLILLGSLFGRRYFFALTNVLLICNAFLIVLMTVEAWRRGNRNALLFTVAWSPLTFVVLVGALMNLGLMMPSFDTIDAIRVGSGAEALLFAAALAHRMSSMRRAEADARAALNETRARLSETFQRQVASLNTLVGGVAHEIGNPLNFAAGGAKDVLHRLGLAKGLATEPVENWNAERAASLCNILGAAERSAGLAARGTERIDSIVQNLRTYSGTGSQSPEPTDIDECIRSTVSLLDNHLKAKTVNVVLDLGVTSPVQLRRGEMNQVIMNLVLNAFQAIVDSGTVVITSEQKQDEIRIVIADSGPGIPTSRRKAVFDPFFTTRAPNQGTGLGLSVSQEIVRRHGGTLELLPAREGQGAEFAISLPR